MEDLRFCTGCGMHPDDCDCSSGVPKPNRHAACDGCGDTSEPLATSHAGRDLCGACMVAETSAGIDAFSASVGGLF